MWVTDAKGVNVRLLQHKIGREQIKLFSVIVTKVLIKMAIKMNTHVIYKCMDM